MTVNILTPKQACSHRCRFTSTKDWPDKGDARQCPHGKWWVATGRRGNASEWRRATWIEARRARRLAAHQRMLSHLIPVEEPQ